MLTVPHLHGGLQQWNSRMEAPPRAPHRLDKVGDEAVLFLPAHHGRMGGKTLPCDRSVIGWCCPSLPKGSMAYFFLA